MKLWKCIYSRPSRISQVRIWRERLQPRETFVWKKMGRKQINQENINLWCESQGWRQKGEVEMSRVPCNSRKVQQGCQWSWSQSHQQESTPSLRIGPALVFSVPVALNISYFVTWRTAQGSLASAQSQPWTWLQGPVVSHGSWQRGCVSRPQTGMESCDALLPLFHHL